MALVRRSLSEGDLALLRRVAGARGPVNVALVISPWAPTCLDRLVERELLRELGRGDGVAIVEATDRGRAELALLGE